MLPRTLHPAARALSLALALVWLILSPIAAQESAMEAEAPLPEPLIGAERVCVMNSVMHFSIYATFLEALEDWERFEIVEDPTEADLVMAISARPDFTSEEGGEGRAPGTVMVMDKLYFKVFVPGGEDVWVDEVELGDDDRAAAELIDRLRRRIETQEAPSEDG